MIYELELEKENFKFAATHFAIFGPSCGERLHGHNYYVKCLFPTEELDANLGLAIEFNELKPQIKSACESLDEYVLLPARSPYLQIHEKEGEVEVHFHNKRYLLPASDVQLLPLLNISCEELAGYIWQKLYPFFTSYPHIKKFSIQVQETRGQRATYTG